MARRPPADAIEQALAAADPQLGRLIAMVVAQIGRQRPSHAYGSNFEALASAIISQQLSVKSAQAIFARFHAALNGSVTPAKVAALDTAQMQAIGLSGSKGRYLHNLAAWFMEHSAKLDDTGLTDEGLTTLLTQISGIGVWTVQMFQIFYLGQPDILPTADLGVQKGVQLLYGLKRIAAPGFVARKARAWRPYRSIACLYLWCAFDCGVHRSFAETRLPTA